MSQLKLPKIHINAEFQRLYWTNVRMGLIAGTILLFGLFVLAKDEHTSWHRHLQDIGTPGLFVSLIVGYILLERSLKQDISSNVFDQLRMSSLSAWQMAWSRIVVAPLVAWTGMILSWIALLVANYVSDLNYFIYDYAALLTLPFLAWSIACFILANALSMLSRNQNRQWIGTLVQLILLSIVLFIWGADLCKQLDNISLPTSYYAQYFPLKNTLLTGLLLTLFASVFAWARMANVLHLRRVDKMYIVLAVFAPILHIPSFINLPIALANTTLIYGVISLVSLATQGVTINRANLPVWLFTAPLGILATLFLFGNISIVWLKPFIFGLILAVVQKMRLGLNSITLGLVVYLLGYWLYQLI